MEWQPGDPLYPAPVPWSPLYSSPQHVPEVFGHRDNGRCWCDQPSVGRPPQWTARFDPEHPVPRFLPAA